MNQVPPRYSFVECLPPRSLQVLPATLRVLAGSTNYKAVLIRLLTGTANISCAKTGRIIRQRENYSRVGYTENARVSARAVTDSFSSFSNPIDLDNFLARTASSNTKFYMDVLSEYLSYFDAMDRDEPTIAFLHLYRALESMAYSFPLIWASRTKNYERTFEQLRKYFVSPEAGELRVFQMFLKGFFDPPIVYDAHVQINLLSRFAGWQVKYYEAILKCLDARNDIYPTALHAQVEIRFGAMTGLAINLRNRYFHFLTGKAQSFSSEDIPDPNEFFLCINKEFANWLAVVFFQILEHEVKNS